MFQKCLYSISVAFITLWLVSAGSITASELIVELDVKPPNTEISTETPPVAISANVQGTELKFDWQLAGVGSFQGNTDGYAVVYVPPTTINGTSAVAIVSVKVSDYRGQEATESVVFTITQSDSGSEPMNSQSTETMPPESTNGTLIFSENFEKGIQRNIWQKDGNTIELSQDPVYGKCVKISRTSPGRWTSLRKKFKGYSGTLVFEAMIKVEHVEPGKESWHRARFATEITSQSGEQRWPGILYGETFDWSLERFEAPYIEDTEVVELMFSLLFAKGTIYVDEVKVYHIP